jgi:hypothetical protein
MLTKYQGTERVTPEESRGTKVRGEQLAVRCFLTKTLFEMFRYGGKKGPPRIHNERMMAWKELQ